MVADYTKEFFQTAWGTEGYYEKFSYGVGIDKVCEVALMPFYNVHKTALEIGSGGGVFTERMIYNFKHLTAIDVIAMPDKFKDYQDFSYRELTSQNYQCSPIWSNSVDFVFSYNVFCHLSNDAIKQYLHSVHRVLKPDGDFVFMLSNIKNIIEPEKDKYSLGDSLPMGHYYQDHRTLEAVINPKEWDVVSRNLIPEHRDIIIHLTNK